MHANLARSHMLLQKPACRLHVLTLEDEMISTLALFVPPTSPQLFQAFRFRSHSQTRRAPNCHSRRPIPSTGRFAVRCLQVRPTHVRSAARKLARRIRRSQLAPDDELRMDFLFVSKSVRAAYRPRVLGMPRAKSPMSSSSRQREVGLWNVIASHRSQISDI